MSHSAVNVDHLFDLAGAICDETASHNERLELNSMMLADLTSRRSYLGYCQIHAALKLQLRAHRATQKVHQQINSESIVVVSGDSNTAGATSSSPFPSPAPTFPATLFNSTVGWLSSGWPVAYLIATVVVGIGLLVGALVHVSQPEQIAKQSPSVTEGKLAPDRRTEVVGQISGMVDCQWADGSTAALDGARVPLGRKYAIASGLIEITYDTGAKVILQGPLMYEVESKNGGFLSIGKLTARLENKAEGGGNQKSEVRNQKSPFPLPPSPFVVRTPTATVIDLGTEFGVRVSQQGEMEVHTLQGAVAVQLINVAKNGTRNSVRVTAGQAVRVGPRDADLAHIECAPKAFVRKVDARRGEAASGPTAGGTYSRTVLADHPVAYYRLNETAVYTAADASGSRTRGGLDAAYVSFGVGVGAGNIGQAGPRPTDLVGGSPLLGFEANNHAPHFVQSELTRVQRADHGTGDALNVTGALSLEAWVCTDRYSDHNQGIVSKWWSSEGGKDIAQRSYGLYIDNSSPGHAHGAAFTVSSDGTAGGIVAISGSASRAVPIGQWVHLAATFLPRRSMRVYCNGELQAAQTVDVPGRIFDSAAPFRIGTHHDRLNAAVHFSGRIADVAIYNYALDDRDGDGVVDADNRVTAHYMAAFMALAGPKPISTNR